LRLLRIIAGRLGQGVSRIDPWEALCSSLGAALTLFRNSFWAKLRFGI
jgi:hypothetical protein